MSSSAEPTSQGMIVTTAEQEAKAKQTEAEKQKRIAEIQAKINQQYKIISTPKYTKDASSVNAKAQTQIYALQAEMAALKGTATPQQEAYMKYGAMTQRQIDEVKYLEQRGYSPEQIKQVMGLAGISPTIVGNKGFGAISPNPVYQAASQGIDPTLLEEYQKLQPSAITIDVLNPSSSYVSKKTVYFDPLYDSPSSYQAKQKQVEKATYESLMAEKPTDRPQTLDPAAAAAIYGSPKGGGKDLAGITTPEGTLLRIDKSSGAVVSGKTVGGVELSAAQVAKEQAKITSLGVNVSTLTGRQEAEQMLREEAKPPATAGEARSVVTTVPELSTSKNPALQKLAEQGKSIISTKAGTVIAPIPEDKIERLKRGEFISSENLANIPYAIDALADSRSYEKSLQEQSQVGKNVLDAMLPSGALISREQVGQSVDQYVSSIAPKERTSQELLNRSYIRAYQSMPAEQKAAIDNYASRQGLTKQEALRRLVTLTDENQNVLSPATYTFTRSPKSGELVVTKIRGDQVASVAASYLRGNVPEELKKDLPAIKTSVTAYAKEKGISETEAMTLVLKGELTPFSSTRLGESQYKLLTPLEVESELLAAKRTQQFAIGQLKQWGYSDAEIQSELQKQYRELGYTDAEIKAKKLVPTLNEIEKIEPVKYVLREKSVEQQVGEGLPKPYEPFVGIRPDVSIWDDVFAAGEVVVGTFTGNDALVRKGRSTMDRVGQYYGAYPIELATELSSEAAFAIVTGFGIGTGAKLAVTKVPKVLAALQKTPKYAIPVTGKTESGLELIASRDILVKQEIRSAIETSTEFTKPQKNLLLRQLKDVEKLKAEVGVPVETGLEASHLRVLNRILKDVSKSSDERASDFNTYLRELERTGSAQTFKETPRLKEIVKKYGGEGIESSRPSGSLYQNIFEADIASPKFSEVAYRKLYEPVAEVAAKGKQVIDDVAKWFGIGAPLGVKAGAVASQYEFDESGQWTGYEVDKLQYQREPRDPFSTVAPSSALDESKMNREIESSLEELNRFTGLSSIKLKPFEESPKDFVKTIAASSVGQYEQEVEYSLAEISGIAPSSRVKKKEEFGFIFDPEEYAKELQRSIAVSSAVYDPTKSIQEKTFNVEVLKGITAPSSRKEEETLPAEIAKLQKDIEQSFRQPFAFGKININALDYGELLRTDLIRVPKLWTRTPTKITTTDFLVPDYPSYPPSTPFKFTSNPPSIPFFFPKGKFAFDDLAGSGYPSTIEAWTKRWYVPSVDEFFIKFTKDNGKKVNDTFTDFMGFKAFSMNSKRNYRRSKPKTQKKKR